MEWGCRKAAISAALFLAAIAGVASEGRAETVKCSGPFAHCAVAVGAKCERENGKTMIVFYDKGGYSSTYEECVGKVYEKHGRQNPYRPGQPPKPAQNR